MDHLKRQFSAHYTPKQALSLDECMVPFRGRLSFKQYHKDKPIKWGIKVWMVAEAESGYCLNFDVYVGKTDQLELNNIKLASKVVISLCQPYYDKGYHVYFDRFYTSPLLLWYLEKLGLGACGTALTNRKFFPKELRRGKSDMARGEFHYQFCTETKLLATVWCDKKPIYFLSNIHTAEVEGTVVMRTNENGKRKQVPCTPSVLAYNKYMGEVDLNDKMTKLDKSKRTYKWYIRLERKCLFWSLYNAYIIEGNFVDHHLPGKRKRDFRSFIYDVAHELVADFIARKRKRGRESGRIVYRLTDTDHMPIASESNDHACVVCAEKHKRYKKRHPGIHYSQNLFKKVKTCFMCNSESCKVHLCLKKGSTCWRDWHSKLEFWK